MLMIRRYVPAAATRTRPGFVLDRCQADGVACRIRGRCVNWCTRCVISPLKTDARVYTLYSRLLQTAPAVTIRHAFVQLYVTVPVGHILYFGGGFGDAILPYNHPTIIVSYTILFCSIILI